ncbi:MAG: pyridoxal phosphate-dependent aminotransferase [Helicobacter sp.]|nr:pyridoxal phosphate-dependent aminotransferase [Helicobacter sp.]
MSFSIGEPDFNTPDLIKEAAIAAINNDFSRYTDVSGILELREAIAKKLNIDNNLPYSANEIIINNGAKHSIFNAFGALLNPDDIVLIPAPFWVTYPEVAKFFGAKSLIINTTKEDGFKISANSLERAIKEAPKMPKILVLNSPSNPTGAIYSRSELLDLHEVLKGTNIAVLSDEIYEKLDFSGKFTSFGSLNEDALLRTITINGLSKSCAMTGYRFGYVATRDKTLLKLMKNLQSQSTSNINSITQKAALLAFGKTDAKIAGVSSGDRNVGSVEDEIKKMRDTFKRRRDLGISIISKSSILSENFGISPPDGAFYFFIKLKKYDDDMRFCSDLLEQKGVVLVPGISFGAKGFVRMSFACNEDMLEAGLARIEDFFKN